MNYLYLSTLTFSLFFLLGCAPDTTTYIWEIGRHDNSVKGFDTNPRDDAERVQFEVGAPIDQFPHGLGTDIGLQRSEIEIRFRETVPKGSSLVVSWSPGGTESPEQFEVLLDGYSIGKSRELTGSIPYPWHTEVFPLSGALQGTHSIILSHEKGDGTSLDFIGLAKTLGTDLPRD